MHTWERIHTSLKLSWTYNRPYGLPRYSSQSLPLDNAHNHFPTTNMARLVGLSKTNKQIWQADTLFYSYVFMFLFSFFQLYPFTAIPKSLLRRPSKKVETYVQGCVPIYPNTILSYAFFISDSDHLTCSVIQFHTVCPTARSPNTCYSPGLNTHVIQIIHYHFVPHTIMHL